MLIEDLTFAQSEILNVELFHPGTAINNVSAVMYLDGDYSYEEINNALNNLVENYDAYRIQIVQDEAKQYIKDFEFKSFPYLQFEDENTYNNWIHQQANQCIFRFDSELAHFTIIKLPNEKHAVFFLNHHLVTDGWSMVFATNYIFQNLLQNEQATNTDSYLDIVQSERKYLESNRFNIDREYWSKQLESYEDTPFLTPIKGEDSENSRKSFKLTPHENNIINEVCNDYAISYSTLFSALTHLYFSRLARNNKNSIGLLLHNRNSKIEKSICGLFSRVLPLLVETDPHESVESFITKVRRESFNLMKHRKYPYQRIVEENDNATGLIDCMISYQNTQHDDNNSENGFHDEWLDIDATNAKLSIHISDRNNENKLNIDYDYNTSYLSESDVDLLHQRLLNVLSQFHEKPQSNLNEIEIISQEEKSLIMNEFNHHGLEIEPSASVVETFEQQVKSTPHNIAVIYEDESLTYEMLNQRANQLARHLQQQGVSSNDAVALITQKNIDTVVGIYAILKTGGHYIPIDPSYPDSRINYILEDSQPKAVLTDDVTQSVFSSYKNVMNLNTADYEHYAVDNLNVSIKNDQVLYSIYTSGTTGNPKGVLIANSNVINLVYAYQDLYGLSENDIILQFASLSFDQSVWDIFTSTLLGSTVCLVPERAFGDPNALTTYMQNHKVTVATLTPSFIKELVPEALPELKVLESGAEEAQIDVLSQWCPTTKVFNTYGPTEATVNAATYQLNGQENGVVPIGKPIPNTQAYILDDSNNLMGLHMPGELCIAGPGVALGYLNQPELTKKSFIANPFGSDFIYKTGDLTQWRSDGNIEYLGRIDKQVKIRGHRVELGEIESKIRQIDKVSDVAVITKQVINEEHAVCAYVVTKEDIRSEAIRSELNDKLPHYMIPTYIMEIDNIPVTVNGKLDKKALPKVTVTTKNYIAPRNNLEEMVVDAFKETLQLSKVSVNDNFFDIGGDSLKAIKIVSTISKHYNIGIKDVFEYQNAEKIAEVLSSRKQISLKEKLQYIKEQPTTRIEYKSVIDTEKIENYKQTVINRYSHLARPEVLSTRNILLTGSTGYLGIHLLRELLTRTHDQVTLIIRPSQQKSIEDRLKHLWQFYFNEDLAESFIEKLIFIKGDIEKPLFNLSQADYDTLADNIDLIINSAANVNHFAKFENSKATNVTGVINLIEFAKYHKKKEIHHMSTVSVASGGIAETSHAAFTEEDLDIGQTPHNVYIQTKFNAEKILLDQRENDLDINIYRIGNLQCHSVTGKFQKNPENNAFFRIINALVNMKLYPSDLDMKFDFTCIDMAANACVTLIKQESLSNENYHIFNNNLLNLQNFLNIYNESGYDVRGVEWRSFIDYIIENIENEDLSQYINDFLLHRGMLDDEIKEHTHFDISNFKTNFILDQLDVKWKQVDDQLINKMISNFQ